MGMQAHCSKLQWMYMASINIRTTQVLALLAMEPPCHCKHTAMQAHWSESSRLRQYALNAGAGTASHGAPMSLQTHGHASTLVRIQQTPSICAQRRCWHC
eukprot:1159388-Pelagomonas_calceolata.AAC.23